MAQTVKLKRSATPAKVPATTDLSLGELAINTYDGKLYLKKNVGGTESIVDVTAGSPAGSSGQIQFNASGSFGASADLVWDSANGRLGVGLASPAGPLHVNKSQNAITAFYVSNYTSGASASAGFQLIGGTLNSAFEANLYDNNGFPYASFKTGSAVGGMYFDSAMTVWRSAAGSEWGRITSAGLTLATALSVANGGTGAATLTGLIKGNGTSAFTAATAGVDYAVPKRVVSYSDATSITLNADTTDVAIQANTQSAGTLTVNAPSGTPVDSQQILFRLRSTNVQTFSWNGAFAGSTDLPLPTASSGSSKWDYFGFIYNSAAAKWHLIAHVLGF